MQRSGGVRKTAVLKLCFLTKKVSWVLLDKQCVVKKNRLPRGAGFFVLSNLYPYSFGRYCTVRLSLMTTVPVHF